MGTRTTKKQPKKARKATKPRASREYRLRFRRHLWMMQRIKEDGPVSMPQLCERWNDDQGETICTKTVQRDIGYLIDHHQAPIQYDASAKGWVCTDPNYEMGTIQLTEGELFALVVAERALQSIRNAPLAAEVRRVFQRICSTLDERISVDLDQLGASIDFTDEHPAEIDPELFNLLTRAIRDKRLVELEYTSAEKRRAKRRVVEPYHLRCHHGDWYLVGRYHETENVPLLALRRMQNARLLKETFEAEFDAREYFKGAFGFEVSDKTWQVKIRFSPEAAFYIREKPVHPEEKREEKRNGSLVLSFPTRRLEEVQRWVMSWGAEAMVLAPAALRKAIADDAGALQNQYRQSG